MSCSIHRYPNKAGLMRGPNMLTHICVKCLEHKTHGYWIYVDNIMKQAIFICDDCLIETKKR